MNLKTQDAGFEALDSGLKIRDSRFGAQDSGLKTTLDAVFLKNSHLQEVRRSRMDGMGAGTGKGNVVV